MISVLFDLLSWISILGGSAFAVIGGIGVIRFPDFYTRLHAGGVTDTLGAGLVMLGLMLQAFKVGLLGVEHGFSGSALGSWLVAAKLAVILFFLLITSPTGCHALAQAALSQGVEPKLSRESTE